MTGELGGIHALTNRPPYIAAKETRAMASGERKCTSSKFAGKVSEMRSGSKDMAATKSRRL